MNKSFKSVLAIVGIVAISTTAVAQETPQGLEEKLKQVDVAQLAKTARAKGNAKRGALVFYKSAAACIKCHTSGQETSPLGPDLATIGRDLTDQYIINSILRPSDKIKQGYETVTIATLGGQVVSGLVADDREKEIVVRDAANLEKEIVVKKDEIDEIDKSEKSMMPEGLVASLRDERQFYDLARYVMEIAYGGPDRAAALKPTSAQLVVKDDTKNLDHAGILRKLGQKDFEIGRGFYKSHCINCHGPDGNKPSLPTARAFGTQKLKFGADPYHMLRTLTLGNGLMAPMSHLSPKERYQVIHFIREQFMKDSNPGYVAIDDAYLASLPKGKGKGEFVVSIERNYGPVLGSQLGGAVNNSLTFRLPDDVSVNYDLHRMRLGGVWQGGFLDLSQTQHYRQRGERMPKPKGSTIAGLETYAWQLGESFDLPENAKTPRGPVRTDWAKYHGHYLYGDQAILSFAIHQRDVLETLGVDDSDAQLTLAHTYRVEPGEQTLRLAVAQYGKGDMPSGVAPSAESKGNKSPWAATGRVAYVTGPTVSDSAGDPRYVSAAVSGDTTGLTWEIDDQRRIVLTIPASDRPHVFRLLRSAGNGDGALKQFQEYASSTASETVDDLKDMTRGGPTRWPQKIEVTGSLGESINGYALDTIPVPFDNPWNSWMRTSALDFFDDGRCVVTTHGGDVYIVSGIDDKLENVTWSRFASGLFEPFGVRVVDGTIYLTCRDGLKRLHDYDGNGEADFVEAFWNDDDVSSMFHAYNFDLQTDSKGNFYFAKAGQYTNHHRPGTIMRVPPEGGKADVVAWGIRTPNGMGKLNDDRFTVSDNQGPWMPAGKVSLITPGAFLGNMPNKSQEPWTLQHNDGALPETFDEPFIWTPQELDNSCGGQVWAGDRRWGPISGRLIHSSFGKGWLYYLSLQEIDGKLQSSIVKLPHQWQAGVMRLRVNPKDGQVYGTGLSGWQGPRGGKDGCLQRVRYTGDPVRMIEQVRVTPIGIELTFNFAVDTAVAGEQSAWNAEMWDYLWSKKYGSDQFSVLKPGEKGRDKLSVQSVTFSNDDKTVHLKMPDLAVCDQVSLKLKLKDAAGADFAEHVYLTIHAIPGN